MQMEEQCTEKAALPFRSALVHDLPERALVKVVRPSFPFILHELILFTANKPQGDFLFMSLFTLHTSDTGCPFHPHQLSKTGATSQRKAPPESHAEDSLGPCFGTELPTN